MRGVALRRVAVLVPAQLLDLAQVRAGPRQLGSKGVPERVPRPRPLCAANASSDLRTGSSRRNPCVRGAWTVSVECPGPWLSENEYSCTPDGETIV